MDHCLSHFKHCSSGLLGILGNTAIPTKMDTGTLVPEEMAHGHYKHSVLRHFISELIRRYQTLEVKGQREEHRQRNIYLYLAVCYTIE